MPRFCANLTMLWNELDFVDRFAAAAKAGFTGVEYLLLIPHMQLADNPGRHEPGTGEINYPFLFGHIDRIGYQGWIGCEYQPLAATDAGLGWVGPYLQR